LAKTLATVAQNARDATHEPKLSGVSHETRRRADDIMMDT